MLAVDTAIRVADSKQFAKAYGDLTELSYILGATVPGDQSTGFHAQRHILRSKFRACALDGSLSDQSSGSSARYKDNEATERHSGPIFFKVLDSPIMDYDACGLANLT